MIPVILLLALLLFLYLGVKRKAIKEGTWLGTAGVKAKYMWDHASLDQRKMMLASISITEGTYRDDLLTRSWAALPPMIIKSLSETILDIDQDQKL